MAKGHVLIECPNTIFEIIINSEHELTKLEIFMGNIRTLKHLSVRDIYNWCNRQGIQYRTRFNYRKDFSFWRNIKSYFNYSSSKMKNQMGFSF